MRRYRHTAVRSMLATVQGKDVTHKVFLTLTHVDGLDTRDCHVAIDEHDALSRLLTEELRMLEIDT